MSGERETDTGGESVFAVVTECKNCGEVWMGDCSFNCDCGRKLEFHGEVDKRRIA